MLTEQSCHWTLGSNGCAEVAVFTLWLSETLHHIIGKKFVLAELGWGRGAGDSVQDPHWAGSGRVEGTVASTGVSLGRVGLEGSKQRTASSGQAPLGLLCLLPSPG